MSQPSKLVGRRVLVIGAQGVLGALLVRGFEQAGWKVTRGGRRPDERSDFLHVDLDEPETVATAIGHADVVLNPVPDGGLVAERMVLDQGGCRSTSRPCPPPPAGASAGIAPGVTNLIAADLLAVHPEADEVELAFTVSTKSTSGRAGGDFAHRNVTTIPRHRTAVIPLPEPFGTRRCLGFAEPDAGWLGTVAADRAVSPYVCIAERGAHRTMLALNKAGVMSRLPRATFRSPPVADGDPASREPVAHWIAVLKEGQRIAARTLECAGDYRGAAQSAVAFADALTENGRHAGVFYPEDVLSLSQLARRLHQAGIAVIDRRANCARLPAPE